ncbi:MAG TPA: hypothetical protein VGC56_17450 [Allosphingosinicella sp.]
MPLLAAGCGTSGREPAKWHNGNSHDFCEAIGEAAHGKLDVHLAAGPIGSAVSVSGDALAGLATRDELPGVTLIIDGEAVRAAGRGMVQLDGRHSVDFFFDPRMLIRRHPGGFVAAVQKDGGDVYRIDGRTPEAKAAFERLLNCDNKLGFGGGLNPWRDLHVSGR